MAMKKAMLLLLLTTIIRGMKVQDSVELNAHCLMCKVIREGSIELVKSVNQNIDSFLASVCKIAAKFTPAPYKQCISVCKMMAPSLITSYMRLVSEKKDFICGLVLNICPSPQISWFQIEKFANNIINNESPRTNKTQGKSSTGKTYTILQVNDIHLDPQYKQGAIGNCNNGIVCCRENSTISPNDSIFRAGKFGFRGDCDLPLESFKSFLEFASSTIKPDYMYWLGDNEDHELDEVNQEFNFDVTEYISKAIGASLPKTKVYTAIGNHESYPVDSFDHLSKLNEKFLSGMADSMANLLSKDEHQQVKKRGFYSTRIEGRSLKIISLLSHLYDTYNMYLLDRTFDPLGMIQWLIDELKDSESKAEAVHIITHIPMGGYGVYAWVHLFNAIAQRYSNTIKGIFSAHTHFDEIVFHTPLKDETKLTVPEYVGPSLTTFSKISPSFRVFEIDEDSHEVIDYKQYQLDLESSNLSGEAKWKIVYSFKDEYQLDSMNQQEMQMLFERIESGERETLKVYQKNKFTLDSIPERLSYEQKISLQCSIKDDSLKMLKCYTKDPLNAPVGALFTSLLIDDFLVVS